MIKLFIYGLIWVLCIKNRINTFVFRNVTVRLYIQPCNMRRMPDNFDWQFYCHYYEDLRIAGIDTEKKASDHYLHHGVYEKRIYHPSLIQSDVLPLRESFYGVDVGFEDMLLSYLQPHYKVLEVGCGVGRLATQIATQLPQGKYCGLDVDRNSIDWCRTHLTPSQSNCLFHHLSITSTETRFPFTDEEFDIIFSTSTLAHLTTEEIQRYLSEMSRILKRGGQCFLVCVLWNPFLDQLVKEKKLQFKSVIAHETYHCVTSMANESANAYHEGLLSRWIAGVHLQIREMIYGYWSGGSDEQLYKDLLIATKISKNKIK